MTLINRYVVAEVLKIFLVGVGILTMIMIIWGGYKEASQQGLEPRHFLKIVPYLLPDALRFGVPAALLFAVSLVFGRMAGSNEIVALKSLGISPMTILWPIFILGFVLSLTSVWLNDLAVSWGRTNMQRIVVQSLEEIIYGVLRTQGSFNSKKFSIIVKAVDEHRLIKPTITFHNPRGGAAITLQCDEAEMRSDLKEMTLTIICQHGKFDAPGQGTFIFDEHTLEIPLDAASQAGDTSNVPSHMALYKIPEEITAMEQKIAIFERQRAAKVAYGLLEGNFSILSGTEAQNEEAIRRDFDNNLARLRTELPRRWASGFSCLCFALIGAPMAIWRRNSYFLTSFFLCFGPILVIYYPLLMFGVQQAKRGTLPPMSVWIGNVVLALAGMWLLKKIIRY